MTAGMKPTALLLIAAMLATGSGCRPMNHSNVGTWWYDQGDKYETGDVTKPKG